MNCHVFGTQTLQAASIDCVKRYLTLPTYTLTRLTWHSQMPMWYFRISFPSGENGGICSVWKTWMISWTLSFHWIFLTARSVFASNVQQWFRDGCIYIYIHMWVQLQWWIAIIIGCKSKWWSKWWFSSDRMSLRIGPCLAVPHAKKVMFCKVVRAVRPNVVPCHGVSFFGENFGVRPAVWAAWGWIL